MDGWFTFLINKLSPKICRPTSCFGISRAFLWPNVIIIGFRCTFTLYHCSFSLYLHFASLQWKQRNAPFSYKDFLNQCTDRLPSDFPPHLKYSYKRTDGSLCSASFFWSCIHFYLVGGLVELFESCCTSCVSCACRPFYCTYSNYRWARSFTLCFLNRHLLASKATPSGIHGGLSSFHKSPHRS